MPSTQKIRTCLWFDKEAEEAANFYVSLFDNSRVLGLSRYGKGMPLPEGTVMTIDFELSGTRFMGLNGGPVFKFTEASSMVVECARKPRSIACGPRFSRTAEASSSADG
jgi:predicted 3-demethylubiquinone-9 3-methyltransferase (glyoxalase superfamily)